MCSFPETPAAKIFLTGGQTVLQQSKTTQLEGVPLPEYRRSMTSEIITVFKRRHEFTTSVSKMAKMFPEGEDVHPILIHFFGLGPAVPSGILLDRKVLVGYPGHIYEYEIKKDSWIRVKKVVNIQNTMQHLTNECVLDDVYMPCISYSYPDSFPHFQRNQTHIKWLHFKRTVSNTTSIANASTRSTLKDKLKSYLLSPGHRQPGQHCLYEEISCPNPLPLNIKAPTITNVGTNKVILVGGFTVTGLDASNRVFQGEFTENKKDVTWKELAPMEKKRCLHIAFKLRNNIYVAGGLVSADWQRQCSDAGQWHCSCEQYNLEENKWSISRYRLPFPLVNASVSVSADKTFAVITGGLSKNKCIRRYTRIVYKERVIAEADERIGKTIIFTEDKGFQLIDNSFEDDVGGLREFIAGSKLGRMGHVSVTVE